MGKHKEELTEMEEIDKGFEAEAKSYKEYAQAKVVYYQGQGIQIDLGSHEIQNQKAYLLGTINTLKQQVAALTALVTAQTSKGETTNVRKSKTTKKAGSKKRTTKKSGGAKKRGSKKSTRRKGPRQLTDSERQLSLNV